MGSGLRAGSNQKNDGVDATIQQIGRRPRRSGEVTVWGVVGAALAALLAVDPTHFARHGQPPAKPGRVGFFPLGAGREARRLRLGA